LSRKKRKREQKDELGPEKIIEVYPYDSVSIGNAEDYMKKLLFESLEFEQPGKSKTQKNRMILEAKERYRKGEISITTYYSIRELLTERK
jgi:hypothetical protein